MHKVVMTLALGLAMSLPAVAQTIYRTTDAQGNVVFTDDPGRGGEAVDLDPLTVVPSRPVQPLSNASSGRPESTTRYGEPGQPFMPYDVFAIASPEQQTTLPTGAAGNVQVQLAIRPDLRDDHRVRLLVDGQVSQSAMHTDTFLLSNLNRGEHRVQAELLDASGAVRHRTSPLTLYVQRASVNLPSNPNNPANH
ncbi:MULTISPECIES: DUF4124 domain-containing protein [Halomonadaceae]|uniref:DUF4124 domain-containing protein n=1 Tax=Halomonadaceae TaxID=28256 RepID=UPI0005904F1F|nr:DUF4124 domain-containing protein [Chromohalobacter japonicus]MCK0753380.1 DUF4124 domain-containing protein [Chromohalobacter japonicus]NWO09702.1 DUF4124 domain-containing protein [Chromohalobacter salexigens]PSJ20964.1 DUF4124 domain-containing protein [Halomonas sp. ND22Bw]